MRYWLGLMLLVIMVSAGMAHDADSSVIAVLQQYARGISEKNLQMIEAVVDTSSHFTVFESGHVNNGWKDYRDTHLAPELKMFNTVDYRFSNIQVVAGKDVAVATLTYHIAVEMKDRNISGSGVGTFVLVKQGNQWKIRHIHTTRKPRKH